MMGLILGFFFTGITFLNYWFGIVPTAEVTVLSQVGEAVFGKGIMYYVLQFVTALILAVAANTGFSAFPVLAYNLAKDKFLPHRYQDRGDRLGYSNGIITLALGSIILLLIFCKGVNGALNSLVFSRSIHSVYLIANWDGSEMA